MNKDKDCAILQDLLPLYEEKLLHPDTEEFIEEHLKRCQECRHIAKNSHIPLPAEVKTGEPSKKMIQKITLRLTTIQIFFVTIAFVLALGTTVMNNSSGFILSYTILGAVTYLFYRSTLVAVLLAVVPTFVWNCLIYMTDSFGEFYTESFSDGVLIVLVSLIMYLVFTIIGVFIGYCILKIKEEN
ncbi:anti-YlaC sigma factor [Carnobacterium sp. 17-4]|uniref:zf-HC2 domain-containing protein n=1 Tax=Carnobacterium sp. (strain 17-4) TaxID=208596 RepID=UPI00020585DA|nr:zf-HC2 domain-containing protein [Carnobacterium sp. 17-4]AEB29896.1 anti-YlaC sigma factor [Carnobacterium sp. 17-4]